MDWYKAKHRKKAQMADLVATPEEMNPAPVAEPIAGQADPMAMDPDPLDPMAAPAPMAAPEPLKGPQPPHPLPPNPEKIAPGPKKNLFRRNVWRVRPGK